MPKRKIEKADWIIFAIYAIFFTILCVSGSPMYLGDSMQHELQFVTREPIYALLIQLLKLLSIEHAFDILIVVQAVFAVFANTYFTCYIRRYFSLKDYWLAIVLPVQLSIHIITPLASATNMVLTNAIMTEGISYSCYLIYIASVLGMLEEKIVFGKQCVKTLLLAVLLSMIRGQFMTLILVWFVIVSVQCFIHKQAWLKRIALAFLCVLVAFTSRGLLIKTYNYLEQGLFVGTASGKAMMVANVLYVAERSDGDSIEDSDLQQLFYDIFDQAYEQRLNVEFAPKGLIQRAIHHEDCHEPLNFDMFSPLGKEYVTAHTGTTIGEFQLMMVELDEVAAKLSKALMPKVIGRYLITYVSIISLGFVRTVAIENVLLNWYALIMYLLAFVLLGMAYKKKHIKEASFLAVVLLLIISNVTATSLMIECVSRYMIYNLPLFYMALGFIIIRLLEKKE